MKKAVLCALLFGSFVLGEAMAGPPPGPPPGGPMGDVMFTMPLPPPDGGGFGFHVIGEGPAPMLPLFLHRAKLTPEQHAKVREILQGGREDLQNLMTRLEQANERLSAKLFAAADLDPADLRNDVDEVTSLRRQLMERGLKTTLAIRGVMTKEQLAKVAEAKARMDKLQGEMRNLVEGGAGGAASD